MWSWSVLKSRRKPPPDVRFVVGSPDDLLSDQLKTGDVLLFSRCWTQMLPFGAALSEAKKKAFGTRFDHAAVVIADRFGTPHVAEVTYRGVKLRRFDERILRSRSSEILLVPMNVECDDETRAQLERHVKSMTYRTTKSMILLETVGLLKLLANPLSEVEYGVLKLEEENDTAPAASEAGSAVTNSLGGASRSAPTLTSLLSPLRSISFIDESVAASPAVQLVMSCLDRAGAIDASEVARWKPTQLLTPRDFENGAVPLKDGASFGELLPVRLTQ